MTCTPDLFGVIPILHDAIQVGAGASEGVKFAHLIFNQ